MVSWEGTKLNFVVIQASVSIGELLYEYLSMF